MAADVTKQFSFRLKADTRKRLEALQASMRPRPTLTQLIDDALDLYLEGHEQRIRDAKQRPPKR